jgi:hypothetical protein
MKNKTSYTAASGTAYLYGLKRQTRADYAVMGDPTSRYERVYFQVDVYNAQGTPVNFGFVDNEADTSAIFAEIERIDEWARTSAKVLESMHSARD